MNRLIAFAALFMFVGLVLLLSEFRAFRFSPISRRVAPYIAGTDIPARHPLLSAESFRAILLPLAEVVGDGTAQFFGVHESLSTRLTRVHSDLDSAGFRLRQFGLAIAALGVVSLLLLFSAPSALIATAVLIGSPVLALLLTEQRLARRSERWQKRTSHELPVIVEQLGLLLGAGHSLSSGIERCARRGVGVVAQDLERVTGRIRQGESEIAALNEWAETVDVDSVRDLVSVLALKQEAGDLGSLLAEQARDMRASSQRELIEQIEKRGQQVWIPVTVAALLPGLVLMLIPFFHALREFGL